MSALKREVHAVNRRHHSIISEEVGMEIFHFKNRI
jgi:hypothetical protein